MNFQKEKIIQKDWLMALLCFAAAFLVRLIPEIKAGVWPIGYDTFNSYVADLSSYQGPLINWIKSANLLYFLFLPFKALGLSPLIIMKIFGPLLYGGLAAAFYYLLKRFLKFNTTMSLVASLLLIFQLAALRISWDLFRNELGLIFLFIALINLPKIRNNLNLIYLIVFSALVVLSNQLVTVLLGVILAVYFLSFIFRKKYQDASRVAIPAVVSLLLFLTVINFPGRILYDSHISFSSEGNYFGFYFYAYKQIMSYGDLSNLIVTLFWLLFSWILPAALYGFWLLRKNLALTTLTTWLLAGTFSSILFAGYGLIVWDRWLAMLVFPLTIYATYGVFDLGARLGKIKKWGERFRTLAMMLSAVFWLAVLSFFFYRAIPFLTAAYIDAKPPLANDSINSYFPRTMVHNSIGIWKIQSTLNCIKWLNNHAESDSVTIVDNRYRGLMMTEFAMDNRYIITNSWSETLQPSTVEMAKDSGHWPIYLIWNTSRSIDGFDRVFASGDTGIYVALPDLYD